MNQEVPDERFHLRVHLVLARRRDARVFHRKRPGRRDARERLAAQLVFSAFIFVNGGGRMERYELIKGKPLLIAYGGKALRPERLAEIVASAKAGGADLTAYEMKDIGHAFPESEYPAVRKWLRGPGSGRPRSGTGAASSRPASVPTGP